MPGTCPQCQQLTDAPRSGRGGTGACGGCGRTLIRNLADSPSLLKALQNASLAVRTPQPFRSVDVISESFHTFEKSVAPSAADTDSHYAGLLQHDTHTASNAPPPLAVRTPSLPLADGDTLLPFIPGYDVEGVLGRGGMGTVYLARQLSLDRPVALKVMSSRWANDATFVARFTREAYAAARLNHPNLVQVYDIGDVDGARYFSMEHVDGRSLADVTRAAGKLDPETAVGYILQAARGLKHAHDRGMIHRDIKPDNLLLDLHGLVKVADLGLVKTPDVSYDDDARCSESGLHTLPQDMTGCRMALGTPAYMSPEQCRDAAAVDHRADIYSLGCTLYALVTGRQPYDGATAVELMTKHAYSPLVPPEEVAQRVPRELSNVIQKMMAKHPGERYQTMGEVVRTLEQWLGVPQMSARLTVGESQIAALEECVTQFQLAPTAVLRTKLLTGFVAAALFGAVLLTFVGRMGWAFGLAGLVIQSAFFYFLLNGTARRTHLFRRVRQALLGCSGGDWLVAAATLVLFAILLWMLQLFWMWTGFGLIAVALAVALRYGLDRTIDAERHRALAGCERLLRRLRVQGLEEDQVRLFVARYAGRHWEEFFETVFSFEAKIEVRHKLLRGESAGQRERHAAWREPIVALLDRLERSRRAANERRVLLAVERDRLIAAGMPPRQARHDAESAADAIQHHAAAFHTADAKRKSTLPAMKTGSGSGPNLSALLNQPAGTAPCLTVGERLSGALIGPVLRGLLAVVCLSACGMWAVQNQIFTATEEALAGSEMHPLLIDGVPAKFTAWIDSGNIGCAGILLLTSLFYTGQRMAVLVLLGSAVCIVAHRFGIPAVEPVQDVHVGLMLGTVIALVGYRFGRR